MRKRIVSLVVSLALIVAFTPQAYALPEYSVYYAVYYSCVCSPNCEGTLVGEWVHDCDGQWYGWGWRPYENSCAQHVESETLDECSP